MNLQDLYAILPQVCMLTLGMLLLLIELMIKPKGLLRPIAFIGLLSILVLNLYLWINIDSTKVTYAFTNSLVLDEFGLFFNSFFTTEETFFAKCE